MTYGKTLRTAIAAGDQQAPARTGGRRRLRDPDTSQAAAVSVDAETLEQRCFALIKEAAGAGCTAREMAYALGVDRDSISPRLPALRNKFGVMDSGERREKQIVWIAKAGNTRTFPKKTPKNKGGGDVIWQGAKVGYVERGKATYVAAKRDLRRGIHLGGCSTVAEAMSSGRASWGFPLELVESLFNRGVHFIEVPTQQGPRYRAKMETLLGPLGFDIESEDDVSVHLNLKNWTEV